jgi:cytochrome c biogenesis protein CcmG/thiol:disulfide interchange protein DsbE
VTQDAQAIAQPRAVRWGQVAIWVAVAAILVVVWLGLAQTFAAQPNNGKAPDFTLQTFDGQTFRLSEQRGKVVLVNFWASWCAPCEEEAPDLQAAWEKYQDKGVVFIGIAYVDADHKSKAFMEKFGITYMNGPDLGTKISDDYNIKGVPETFIINRDGEVTYFAAVPLDLATLSAELDKALAE